MKTMKMKRTGELYVIRGPVPKNAGDRFQASPAPKATPKAVPGRRGCTSGQLPGSGAFIQCSRGGGSSSLTEPETKTYRYDPELHELVRA